MENQHPNKPNGQPSFAVKMENQKLVPMSEATLEVAAAASLAPAMDESERIKREFKEKLELKRAQQLESLEKSLAGFALFTREMKVSNSRSKKKAHTSLKSVENIQADTLNNNQRDCVFFKESPSFIKAKMRDYQIHGLNWMISLYQQGLNGILADEMGLGKTIQAISMIGYLMKECNLKGPFLVIVPLTTLTNWIKEFARFLPSAKVLRAHAILDDKKEVLKKLTMKRPSWNVAITSYEFIVKHKNAFCQLDFHYAVIDEGHRAKNENTLFAGVLRQCHIQGMVLLTGTPIHNNLHELWALLNLLMPLFFNSSDSFDEWFNVENCLDPEHEQTRRLQNILKPLLLRRIKSEVCKEIPDKVRITLCVPPTEEIREWSRKVLNHDVQRLKPDGSYGAFKISIVFPYLRQVALHPFLLPGVELPDSEVDERIIACSSKMILLDKLLARLKARGSKVLIFSQFKIMLAILEDFFAWRGYAYCTLTGETSIEERQEAMDEFNRDGSDKFIFALSTRAGGLGINLVAADTVIFYDMDFNPQMDFQAEDRAHRIGQLKKVHIFRLLVRGSIEESLHAIADRKKKLNESIIRQKQSISERLMKEATQHVEASIVEVETIDRSVIDEKIDDIFRKIDSNEGIKEDALHILPGIPSQFAQTIVGRSIKRKAETLPVLPAKRTRIQCEFYQH